VGGRKSPFPITLAIGLYNSLYYRTNRDFSEIKDGGRRHLGFVWVSHGTTHEASFMARTSCKNFVMIG